VQEVVLLDDFFVHQFFKV
jgi:hypothetical protein